MGFELCGKRTGQKRRCKHDSKGYWVFTTIGCQRQPGFRQKIIEQDDTQKADSTPQVYPLVKAEVRSTPSR